MQLNDAGIIDSLIGAANVAIKVAKCLGHGREHLLLSGHVHSQVPKRLRRCFTIEPRRTGHLRLCRGHVDPIYIKLSYHNNELLAIIGIIVIYGPRSRIPISLHFPRPEGAL